MTTPLPPRELSGNTSFATSIALLLLRLALGWCFIYHGGQKLFGWFTPNGQPMVSGLAGAINLPVLSPLAWAYVAACGEFFGGLMVLLGLLARLGTIPILVVMWVAIATVHGKHGYNMGNHGYEYNIALSAMAAAILIAGPGLISCDAFLFRRGLWARGPQPLSDPASR